MKKLLVLLISLAGCVPQLYAENCPDLSLDFPYVEQALYIESNTLWPETTLTVCWEENAYAYPHVQEWIKEAAEGSWEAVSKIDFVGWEACGTDDPSIHVTIRDRAPNSRVYAFGRGISGMKDGVVITHKNFMFEELQSRIYYDTIHEFGHVLGFVHEQNHPDVHPVCAEINEPGESGDIPIGAYDPHSVMNYCSYPWGRQLSCGDIAGVRYLYGTNQ